MLTGGVGRVRGEVEIGRAPVRLGESRKWPRTALPSERKEGMPGELNEIEGFGL